jgi:hypothetical protein
MHDLRKALGTALLLALALSTAAFGTTIDTWNTSNTIHSNGWALAAQTITAPGNELTDYNVGFYQQYPAGQLSLSIFNWSGNSPVGSALFSTTNLTWIGDGYTTGAINVALTTGNLYGFVVNWGGTCCDYLVYGNDSYSGGEGYWSFDNVTWTAYPQYDEQFTAVFNGTSTPEPGSMMLLGSGILGVAGVLRRKLML